ncbi:MAG: peptidase [Bacillales bacterium]|nr:peptidase [Bacillales bacterium]
MEKPELLVTPKSIDHISELISAGADAFVIGNREFGIRLLNAFSIEEIGHANKVIKENNKKLYIAVNGLYHNEEIDALRVYITKLGEINVDALIFGDPAVLMIAKEVAPNLALHWSTETTGTNWFTCNYWGEKGSKRAVLAKEINLDAVLEIKENAKVEIEIQIHGTVNMFQSKRTLVKNYYAYQEKDVEKEFEHNSKNLFLADRERGYKYPIFEDKSGTHIMSPKDLCLVNELEDIIDSKIDSLKFDGLLKSKEYITQVTSIYREAIDLCVNDREHYIKVKDDLLNKIQEIQPAERPLDTGFYFKETVY